MLKKSNINYLFETIRAIRKIHIYYQFITNLLAISNYNQKFPELFFNVEHGKEQFVWYYQLNIILALFTNSIITALSKIETDIINYRSTNHLWIPHRILRDRYKSHQVTVTWKRKSANSEYPYFIETLNS